MEQVSHSFAAFIASGTTACIAPARAKLKQAHRLLALPGKVLQAAKLKLDDWLDKIAEDGQDPRLCPHCGKERMITVREFEPLENWTMKLRMRLAGAVGGLLFRWAPLRLQA